MTQPIPAPVDTDQNAQLADLLRRAQHDFTVAEARRQALSNEDRIHGQQVGGVH